MGRNMAKRDKPFRFILNRSKATAANVYLLLYPKPALAKALAENPGLSRQIWEFLNSIDAATLLGEGRVYGGGLYKMEPKELANVLAEAIACRCQWPNIAHQLKVRCSKNGRLEVI
jgi:adenine-specific DNA-methyltransferase